MSSPLPRYPFSGAATVAKEIAYQRQQLGLDNFVASGFAVTSGASTTLTLSAGVAFIDGLQVGDGIETLDSLALGADGTKEVYLTRGGNLSLTVPSGPYTHLYTLEVSGGSTSITTDRRDLHPVLTGGFEAAGQIIAGLGFDAVGAKVVRVGTPTAGTDGANKTYVDTQVAGVTSPSPGSYPVRAATTTNGTLASAFEDGDTIDGVALSTGDRILLKDQSIAADNGIYIVQASGAPVRATDLDEDSEARPGLLVPVSEGTVNADTTWALTTNAPIALGSTSLAFERIDAHGATSSATPTTHVLRDSSGRAQIANPSVDADIDNQGTRNTAIATHAANASAHHARYSDAEALAAAEAGAVEAPTASKIPKYDAGGRTQTNDPVDPKDGVNLQFFEANQTTTAYDDVGNINLPSVGDILAQGYLHPMQVDGGLSQAFVATPGVISPFAHGITTSKAAFSLIPNSIDGSTTGTIYSIGRGTRYSVKGILLSVNTTRRTTTYEPFALGIVIVGTSGFSDSFGHTDELSRDNDAQVAVVVDTSNNVQYYNNALAGDASYTPASVTVNMLTKMGFEIIVEIPSTANSDDDIIVTIKIQDSSGTMQTILNAVNPVSTATGGTVSSVVPLIMMNQDASVFNLTYKVERAA